MEEIGNLPDTVQAREGQRGAKGKKVGKLSSLSPASKFGGGSSLGTNYEKREAIFPGRFEAEGTRIARG